jgi:hypothetical protein
MLIGSYFESIESYRRGAAGKSDVLFAAGLQSVVPELKSIGPSVLGELYNQLRCGLYHQGGPKGRVSIVHGTKPIELHLTPASTLDHALIDPWLLFDAVEKDLARYIEALRDMSQTSLRSAFAKFRATRRAEVTVPTFFPGGARSTFP